MFSSLFKLVSLDSYYALCINSLCVQFRSLPYHSALWSTFKVSSFYCNIHTPTNFDSPWTTKSHTSLPTAPTYLSSPTLLYSILGAREFFFLFLEHYLLFPSYEHMALLFLVTDIFLLTSIYTYLNPTYFEWSASSIASSMIPSYSPSGSDMCCLASGLLLFVSVHHLKKIFLTTFWPWMSPW